MWHHPTFKIFKTAESNFDQNRSAKKEYLCLPLTLFSCMVPEQYYVRTFFSYYSILNKVNYILKRCIFQL